MGWFTIIKEDDDWNEPSDDDISFMRERLNEVVNEVGNIYGLELKEIDKTPYSGHPAGLFFSPNAIVTYKFAVGFEQYGENTDGFTLDEDWADGGSMSLGLDWFDMFNQEKIKNLPKEYQDVENASPVVTYPIAADNMNDADGQNIGIHIKEENPQIESLVIDTYKKYEEKYGKGKKSSYAPMYSAAYSPNEDRMVNADEVMPKDDWKDSLRGKE
tara:strand:+ start:4556 stop:5200 length:645 start_codon:yes stop_codon:yes gene_type:complete